MLVDDHPAVRAGLCTVLTEQGGLLVLADAGDGAAALAQLDPLASQGERVDVVLMDLQMDGMGGIEATRKIRDQYGPPVLILSTFDADAEIRAALEAGAAGYLLKDAPLAEVLAAVTAAAKGEHVLSTGIAARITFEPCAKTTTLGPREFQLLHLLVRGHSDKEIATELLISRSTVKSYLIHLYDKLGVENRTAATEKARDTGRFDGPPMH